MQGRLSRRAALGGGLSAGAALAGGAHGQIIIAKQFRQGRPVTLAVPSQLSATPGLIQADDRAPLPSGGLVHVPAFRVELVTTVNKRASTRGGAQQNSTFQLTGVNNPAMAAMTQALYDGFVAGLTAAGCRVAPLEQTKADLNLSRFFPATGAQAIALDVAEGRSTFYAPRGMIASTLPGDSRGMSGMGALSGFRAVMDLSAAAGRAAQAGAVVLLPRYSLTFVEAEGNQNRFLGGFESSASVSAKAGLRLIPEATRVDAYVPTSGRDRMFVDWFALSSPLLLSGVDLGGFRDATTASQRQAEAAYGATRALMALGGVGSSGGYGATTKAVAAGPRLRETVEPYLLALQSEFVRALTRKA